MKEGSVYLITNMVNGKKYVGKTVADVERRFRRHCNYARHGGDGALQRAIRKYGKLNFSVETVAESLESFLGALEQTFIVLYRSHTTQHGYNMTAGGDGSFGLKHTPETKAKMRLSQTGKKRTLEVCMRMSERLKGNTYTLGYHHSSASRRKMSESHIGQPSPMRDKKHKPETIEKFKKRCGPNHPFFGKHWTEEQAAKFTNSRTNVPTKQGVGSTGYKGVTYTKGYLKPYRAQITGKWKQQFVTAEEAAEAYNNKALELYGNKAILNVLIPVTKAA